MHTSTTLIQFKMLSILGAPPKRIVRRPKMRKLYAKYFRAVDADFSLNLRKSPFSLELIQTEASSQD